MDKKLFAGYVEETADMLLTLAEEIEKGASKEEQIRLAKEIDMESFIKFAKGEIQLQ
jgi:hypothetical protein